MNEWMKPVLIEIPLVSVKDFIHFLMMYDGKVGLHNQIRVSSLSL